MSWPERLYYRFSSPRGVFLVNRSSPAWTQVKGPKAKINNSTLLTLPPDLVNMKAQFLLPVSSLIMDNILYLYSQQAETSDQ